MKQDLNQANSSPGINSRPNWVIIPLVVIALVILWALASLFLKLLVGNPPTVSILIGIISGFSTIALLILTGWYATETQNLVRVSEKALRDEQQRNKRQQQQELDSIRRAFLGEIKSIKGIKEYAEIYRPPLSRRNDLIPTKIYETNAKSIGRLTPDEIEVILDYYGTVKMLETALRIQRLKDTTDEKDAIQQYFIGFLYYWNEFIRWLSRGYITPTERDNRTKRIQNLFIDLADAQKDAISEIEEHLQS